ncbi:MAG: chromate efflux transporter [Rhodospirillales bacterium]|nr:MAG: chromate efflux transporter [Rhodospirillales bacterium]
MTDRVATPAAAAAAAGHTRPLSLFLIFLRLGLTSFGGPIAHLGYFRTEFVGRRKWFDDAAYADLVALCQFLPGPASSQVGIAIGLTRGGLAGAVAAWCGFTLPSAVLMILFAYGVTVAGGAQASGWLFGLKAMAVAVVAMALWQMATTLCRTATTISLALAAAVLVLLWPAAAGGMAVGQVVAIVGGAAAGRLLLPADPGAGGGGFRVPIGRWLATAALVVFVAALAGLPLLAWVSGDDLIAKIAGFYRAGALIFGGGHVVLPLLQAVVVPPGWVGQDAFLAGYGAAQALPGPLLAFSAYLGTTMAAGLGGVLGGVIALLAIYAPSFLLVIGLMPAWSRLRAAPEVRTSLAGVSAAVVGLLLAALYDPVFTATVHEPEHLAFVLVAFALVAVWKLPPWLVAPLAATGGWLAFDVL